MEQLLPRTLMISAVSLCFVALAMGACTHTTDRVIEPVGGGDASTTAPDMSDASVAPIGPVARSHGTSDQDPPPDFTLVRAPEVGSSMRGDARLVDLAVAKTDAVPSMGGNGGRGGNGAGGGGGNDSRPVSTGGTSYF